MKKMSYIDEATFKLKETEFEDEFYELASDIQKQFGNVSFTDKLFVRDNSNGKGLCFFIDKNENRKPGEKTQIYRITIENMESHDVNIG